MSEVADQIVRDAGAILDSRYEITETDNIPDPEDIAYDGAAKRFTASVFSIDIRNSSGLLVREGDAQSGKIHKAFLRICATTIHHFDGEIRLFNGDGLLAFWNAQKQSQLTNPVRAAMGIKWLIATELKDRLVEKYGLDFGIGLSWGVITSFRAGIERVEGANDLVFLDQAINRAVVISKQAKSPYHIECTLDFYGNLENEAKFADQKEMWMDGLVKWKYGDFKSKLTSYYWEF